MTKQDVLLIHGTWGNGGSWDDFAAELTERGYNVHAPTLPGHGVAQDIDVWSSAGEVTKLGLAEYVDFLRGLVNEMATPPIIFGHSLGCLIAQLLAARVETTGVVLIGSAPAAGVFPFYPTTTVLWTPAMFRWILGKPMYPVSKKRWNKYICNTLPSDLSDKWYAELCAESGTVYRQMAFWYLDPKRRAKVDFDAVEAPVLVIAGSEDKCCPPGMNRATAKRYGDRGTYQEIAGSDHMMIAGPVMPKTIALFEEWATTNGIGPVAGYLADEPVALGSARAA